MKKVLLIFFPLIIIIAFACASRGETSFSFMNWLLSIKDIDIPKISVFIEWADSFGTVSFAFNNINDIISFFSAFGSFFAWLGNFFVATWNFIESFGDTLVGFVKWILFLGV